MSHSGVWRDGDQYQAHYSWLVSKKSIFSEY